MAAEITALTNEPVALAARFWGDVYRSMPTETAGKRGRRSRRSSGVSMCHCLLVGRLAFARKSPMNLVAAIDLSASENAKTADGRTLFDRNTEAVGKLLASGAAGPR